MSFDPSAAFEAKAQDQILEGDDFAVDAAFNANAKNDYLQNGKEPILAGELRERAVWVDERKCIGCTYCGSVATNTFYMEPEQGRARVFRQDGDRTELIQEAIDTCPVDCIDWVKFEDLDSLRAELEKHNFRNLGLPPIT